MYEVCRCWGEYSLGKEYDLENYVNFFKYTYFREIHSKFKKDYLMSVGDRIKIYFKCT